MKMTMKMMYFVFLFYSEPVMTYDMIYISVFNVSYLRDFRLFVYTRVKSINEKFP